MSLGGVCVWSLKSCWGNSFDIQQKPFRFHVNCTPSHKAITKVSGVGCSVKWEQVWFTVRASYHISAPYGVYCSVKNIKILNINLCDRLIEKGSEGVQKQTFKGDSQLIKVWKHNFMGLNFNFFHQLPIEAWSEFS